jgi:hypothetical protein
MEMQPKPWWRPLATAIVAAKIQAGEKFSLPMVGNIIADMTDTDFGVDRMAIQQAIVRSCNKGGGLLKSVPSRDKGYLARVFWRHMQFAFGFNVSLHGLISNRFEVSEIEDDVMQDIVFVLAQLNGGNVGADRWRKAIYG